MTSGPTIGEVERNSRAHESSHTGRAVRRLEDADLLRGHGRFGDDLPVRPDTLHAAILRSPHAHAEILSVDIAGALALPGVDCVVTSEDARRWTRPFAVAVKTPMEQWCLAMDRVRYVGEPVAVVSARNRDTAEDAVEQIAVEYRPLPPIVDPETAARRMRRSSIPLSGRMSSANGPSATAIRRPPLPKPSIGFRSRPATRAIPPRQSNALS
jgi:2-furoyl-CoA dehydrogenase large subunit